MAALEAQGYAIALPDGRWCARHLLVRCHGLARQRRRRRVEAVGLADYVDFLCEWQRVEPSSRSRARRASSRRSSSSRASSCPRATGRPTCCPRASRTTTRRGSTSCASRARSRGHGSPRVPTTTPSAAARRRRRPRPRSRSSVATTSPGCCGPSASARRPPPPPHGASHDLLDALERHGAQFRAELATASSRLPVEVDEGLWDLVARGIATADAFSAVRSLLDARARFRARQRRLPTARLARAPRRALAGTGVGEGRWSVLASPSGGPEGVELEELAERVAVQLLVRWGVVAYELTSARERPGAVAPRRLGAAPPRGARRGRRRPLRARGVRRAVRDPGRGADCWRDRREGRRGREVTLSGSDPINLTGTVLPGPRVPPSATARVHRRRGRRDRRGELGPMTAVSDQLVDAIVGVFDFAAARLRARLEGLTDDELLWEPVEGCATVREDPLRGDGPSTAGEATPKDA